MIRVDQLWKQGNYSEVEKTLLSVLAESEKSGSEDIKVVVTLNGLGSLCQELGRYADAERYYQRSILASERLQRKDYGSLASSLNNLATLYLETGRYAKAEPLLRRCLDIRTKVLGADSPELATTLNNLGELCALQHKSAEAEQFFREALSIFEKQFGPQHLQVAEVLKNLALLAQDTERYTDALAYSDRVLGILGKTPNAALLIRALNNRGVLYLDTGRPSEAEPCLRQALAAAEKAFGPEHPDVGGVLTNYAAVMRQTNRKSEAKQLEKRAKAILAKNTHDNLTGYTVDVSGLRSSTGHHTK